jgi:isoleucyl-tRNA synthetase
MSDNVMTQLSEAYRKLRNTFRFALGNLADFDPARDSVRDNQLLDMDAWILGRMNQLALKCFMRPDELLGLEDQGWYPGFEFHRVFHALYDFAAVDLSSFYFDVLKDRLYTFAPRNVHRRSAQTAVFRIARALLRLIAPILSFTAEEVWKSMPRLPDDPESVHLTLLPSAGELVSGQTYLALKHDWDHLVDVIRIQVLKKLEEARQGKLINAALDAKVVLDFPAPATFLEKYRESLQELLIVSQLEIRQTAYDPFVLTGEASEPVPTDIRIYRADGAKCERCWHYSIHVGENADYPTVCERCVKALHEIEHESGASGLGAAS